MKYTRLCVVTVLFIALILWLRQCSSKDESGSRAALDNLKNQLGAQTQGQAAGSPATTTSTPPAPAQTQKPTTGN